MGEELQGTNISKGLDNTQDLDALIKETLEETKKKDAGTKETPVLKDEIKATEIKKEEPVYKATTIKKTPASASAAKPETEATPVKAESFKAEASKEELYEATFKSYKVGDVVKGKVLKVDPSGILVDIKYKADGMIPADEITDKSFNNIDEIVKVGDIIEVCIIQLENKEGYVVLSKRRAETEKVWNDAYDAYKQRKLVEAKVTGAVKGGLVVDYNGIRGFIPASQVSKETDDSFESFVGKSLPIKIIQINRRQGKVVLSHKIAASEKQRFEAGKIIHEIEVGQTRKGKVTSIKKFGAFVDIGGIEGLIHLSELSWKRVNDPSDVLKIGQELDVFVLGVDKESRKVALGLKELQDDPWVKAGELYKPGQIVQCKIARFVKFGAFVDLDGNLEGLIHISELSKERILTPDEVVKVGDTVEVKVLRVLPEEQKIGLSIKEAILDKERKVIQEQKVKEEQNKPKVTIGEIMKDKEEKAKEDD